VLHTYHGVTVRILST